MTFAIRLLTSLLAVLPFFANAAVDEDDLLPVEEAFALQAHADDSGVLQLRFDIAEGYYLYRHRLALASATSGVEVGQLELPAGTPFTDEFFGEVETYRGALAAHSQLHGSHRPATATFEVRYQGCADLGVCYPPQRQSVHVALPVLAAVTQAGLSAPPIHPAPADNPLARLLGGSDSGPAPMQDDLPAEREPPLPEEQAFVFEAIAWSPTELLARFTMPKGYYLYRDGTRFSLSSPDAGGKWQLAAPAWPQASTHTDDHFGDVFVYFDQIELPIAIAPERSGLSGPLQITAQFQGCQLDGICYAPMTRHVRIDMPAADETQTRQAQETVARDPYVATTLKENLPTQDDATPSAPLSLLAILAALLLALVGGVILNLMPCVLPILSLKVLAVAQSGESHEKARRHALWYTAGVLFTFALVGLTVIALRAAGQALGWGFQLQQPLFVAALVYVLFAIGLSLSGVFQIGAGLAGAGQGLASRKGHSGDFFTGVLAVVVASPCTVPFMGSALAFAFASSSWVALLIFLALGLGLALPFLLIGFVPALASRLPKPGAWMDTLKQLLAFPMYLTAVWLIWVLGKQRGIDAVALALIGVTLLALGLWWWERNRYRPGRLARVLALLVMLAALLPLYPIAHLVAPSQSTEVTSGAVPYSADRLASLRAEGRGVFVDMTADWCVTCKMNERTVIHTDRFRELLERSNTTLMVGDWTNVDPHISDFLKEYQSVGVPLYVVFRPGQNGPGQKLPTVLTFGIVEQALGVAAP